MASERMKELTLGRGSEHRIYGGVHFGGAELLRKELVWVVRNGERTQFWKDVWLGTKPLIAEGGAVVELDQEGLKVAHY